MIALITPTGGRQIQFELCQRWMRNQTYEGDVLWVVVDDIEPYAHVDIERKNWQIIQIDPLPAWKSGMNTQRRNLQTGINVVKEFGNIDAVFIIEDDDYYSPIYLEEMIKRLEGYDIAGEINTIYYHIPMRRYRRCENKNHTSLFQTVFDFKILSIFENSLKESKKFFDINFWKQVENKNLFFMENPLSIGIKGMGGRPGIGIGHNSQYLNQSDEDLKMFKEMVGKDFKYYHHI